MSLPIGSIVSQGVNFIFSQFAELIEQFTYEIKFGDGYNPTTGINPQTIVSQTAPGILFNINEGDGRFVNSYRIDSDAVQIGDKKIIVKIEDLNGFDLGTEVEVTRVSDSSKWRIIEHRADITNTITTINIRRTT